MWYPTFVRECELLGLVTDHDFDYTQISDMFRNRTLISDSTYVVQEFLNTRIWTYATSLHNVKQIYDPSH
jgi:hypothetical protein